MTSLPFLPSEILVHTTARIECFLPNNSSIGTAFFFEDEDKRRFLITNRHVVEDATSATLALTGAIATSIAPAIVAQIFLDFATTPWAFHPNESVDLAALSFSAIEVALIESKQGAYNTFVSASDLPSPDEIADFQAVESVLMIGYPDGIWDEVNNQPVSRRGITATHPNRQYAGRSEFMLDIGCFDGSSGSPVFIYDTIGAHKRGGGIGMKPRRPLFIGVLFEGFKTSETGSIVKMGKRAKSVPVTEIPLNLGLAVKSAEVLTLTRSIP